AVLDAARARIRASAVVAFAAAAALPTVLVYAYAAAAAGVASAPGGVPGWLFAAAGRETLGQNGPWTALKQTVLGAATAIVPDEPLAAVRWLGPHEPITLLGAALSGLALAALAALAWIAAPRVVSAWRAADRLTRIALASLFATVVFVGAY